ncbi:hypothetical protein DICA2_F12794 [Diutina catenulata]
MSLDPEQEAGEKYQDFIEYAKEGYEDDQEQAELDSSEEWREELQEQSELNAGEQLDDEYCVDKFRSGTDTR